MTQIRDQIREIVQEEVAITVSAAFNALRDQVRELVIEEMSRQLGESDTRATRTSSPTPLPPSRGRGGRPQSMTKEAIYQRNRRAEKKREAEAKKARNEVVTENVGAAVAETVAAAMKADAPVSSESSNGNGHATGVTTIAVVEEPDLGLSL